jgi:hypothetical protein
MTKNPGTFITSRTYLLDLNNLDIYRVESGLLNHIHCKEEENTKKSNLFYE